MFMQGKIINEKLSIKFDPPQKKWSHLVTPWFIRKYPQKKERMSSEKEPFSKEASSSKHQVSWFRGP